MKQAQEFSHSGAAREAAVMKIFWKRGSGTIADISSSVGWPAATIIGVLVAKGHLAVSLDFPGIYAPCVTRKEIEARIPA